MRKLVWVLGMLCLWQSRAAVDSQTCSNPDTCTGHQPSVTSDGISQWAGQYFPEIETIQYEGPNSKNPLAFHYYNASEEILGRPMRDWLRFSLAFWHTMRGDGSDPFGSPTKSWPWEDASLDPMVIAHRRMEAFFEMLKKLGVSFWCFHDRDIAPEGSSLQKSNEMLDHMVEAAGKLQEGTGIKPLWGTAQLFKHPRYVHGAATSKVNHYAELFQGKHNYSLCFQAH